MSVLYKRPSAEEYSKLIPCSRSCVKRIFTISSVFPTGVVLIIVIIGSLTTTTGSPLSVVLTPSTVVVVVATVVVVVVVFLFVIHFKVALII